jgi:ATP-dependent DNA ligase
VATGFIEGEGRLDGTLGKVKITSADGEPLGHTGSGFTDAMRDEVWENRDEYLGEPLEVSGEALDSQGSIRFPIFQRWRSDDGEADTFKRIEEIMPST